ncbi:glycosyl transferase family 41-domain-containing protein [Xylariomycetidae sp. FL2044]|nr:glycosyl transferase family 41-domain-containing protein [Xylariomycetidae sp. FL2044]
MLPLIQMHQMVQPSTHLESQPAFHPDHRHDHRHDHRYDPLHFRHLARNVFAASSSQRALPIRSSQPSLPTYPRSNNLPLPTQSPHRGEHHLRRKTPSGTIDAGYDGTPAQLASGPPPFKHMILPTSSNPVPQAPISHQQSEQHPSNHPVQPPAAPWPYPSSPFDIHPRNALQPSQSNLLPFDAGWQYGFKTGARPSELALDSAPTGLSNAYSPYNNGVRIPTALQPSYQHPPGPPVFEHGGLLPPPAWPGPYAGNYHGFMRPGVAAYPEPGIQPGAHLLSSDPSIALPNSFGARPRHEQNPPSFQVPAQRLESLTLEPPKYHALGSGYSDTSSPARFREKVLAHAHRTYVELLAFLHRAKKSRSSMSSGPWTSSKMVIFPKIPKVPKQSVCPPNSDKFRDAHSYAPATGENYTVGHQRGPSSNMNPHPVMTMQPPARVPPPNYFGIGMRNGQVSVNPMSGAVAVLEILTHLCEQSEWKWIDGMLLGGCLHYGLEHYEQALDWFQRIISIDADHVEALSNVAAALYNLNRQQEAERYWLQAVQKRPSYLEAVEHLVGMLCSSQRSKEAVDIINYVQRCIRICDQGPHGGAACENLAGNEASNLGSVDVSHSSRRRSTERMERLDDLNQAGFGSSGYCVPGSENGRVIALIHAKGNMLYALKDIDRASEAFEEAVLISTGKKLKCIHSLIRRIRYVLSPVTTDAQAYQAPDHPQPSLSGPLLLPPERARYTAQMVFATHGELPGLRFVPDGVPKKSAISTTSNSLLSLAKIFQDAISNGGSYPRLLRQPPGVGDILALYYLSLSLSESPSTANNVGILLASVQQSTSVPPPQAPDSSNGLHIPGIVPGSGLALALAYYHYGLSLDSKHVHLHTNLGSLLKDIGQLDLAIQMYEQAVACDGTFDIALTNLANAVKDRGRISDAIMYYKRAVSSNPQFAEAVCGLSTALNSVCDWRGRGGVLLQSGKYDRWHIDEEGMLKDAKDEGAGSGLMKKVVDIVAKQLVDSSHWGAGTLRNGALELLLPQLKLTASNEIEDGLDIEFELRKWAGQPWEGSRLLRLIERATKAAMRRWYQDIYIRGRSSHGGYSRPRLPASLAVPAAPTVLPFHTFTCPLTAKDIRMISQRNAARISCSALKSSWLPDKVYKPPPPPAPHLNIGYVSSDFNNHPLAHLMQSVFGFHDPSRAKAFCYATTASDKSIHREQIEREAPVFRDVSSWTAERLVDQIVKDGIHILVNLNGYTRGARNEVFAARPAPIQMSFMGFAGSLGAEWCDYILADETAVPPSTLRPMRNNLNVMDVFQDEELNDADEWVYSENIIFCRDTFFCCDHAQSSDVEERTVTWQHEQRRRWKMRKEIFPTLADDAIIMGNFNQLYKIDPTTFRTWLRILSNVPKAYLWLLRFPELGESNLKRTARIWAGDEVASRIIFTDVAPKQQHISRARVCDLFLDTPECNAHTTAADVLWSSTPLLTLPRYPYKMCSRMAASILKGALPKSPGGEQAANELIASDDAHYEALATRLAGTLTYEPVDGQYCEGRGRLAELRKVLFDAKWTCALFDTHRWVSDLEDAFDEAWRRWVAGQGGDIYL